jgi:hypothetical protein
MARCLLRARVPNRQRGGDAKQTGRDRVELKAQTDAHGQVDPGGRDPRPPAPAPAGGLQVGHHCTPVAIRLGQRLPGAIVGRADLRVELDGPPDAS